MMETIKEYWHQAVFILGLAFIAIRNEITTRRVNKAVFDMQGDPKLQTLAGCRQCRDDCQRSRDMDRKELRDELKSIHSTLQGLPAQIIRMIKDMNLHS